MNPAITLKNAGMLWLLLVPAAASFAASEPDAAPVLTVPSGFRIDVVAEVPNARSLVLSEAGTLYVSSQFGGKVHAVTGVLSGRPVVHVIDEKLRIPNGIAIAGNDLLVAEPTRLLRYRDIEERLDNPGEPEVLADDLPAGKQHSWKYMATGPDEKLYLAVGSPCNVCDEPDYGVILRMDPDGSGREVVARGIRNTVGFDWQPVSGELWFTDNNRDMMGDDEPPGELNRLAKEGLHFGFPFCHGIDTVEPEAELAKLGTCADSEAPVIELPAHVAALGLAFYDGAMFPPEYRNQIFIAEHGSWNRTEKTGYRVSLVRLDESGRKAVSYEVFAEGWLQGDSVGGRPADVIVAPDGSLLVSDDKGGRIYRISYAGAEKD